MKYELVDHIDKKQFEFHIDGTIARIEYIKVVVQKDIYLTHTEVPRSLEGNGIGSKLIKSVLERIKDEGWTLIPLCPFIALYLKRHPEYKALVLKGIHIE